MYDIYLLMGCKTPPDLEDIMTQVPTLTDPSLQLLMLQRSPRPGFLGLDLPEEVAIRLLQRLINAGALCQRFHSAYRHPRITIEQAAVIAEKAIAEQQMTLFPNPNFGPVRLASDQIVCWSFKAISKQRILFINVDKLDGHIWQKEALDRLKDEANFLQSVVLKSKAKESPVAHWAELFDVYDIYLTIGCHTFPDIENLSRKSPILADPAVQKRILRQSTHPGFLGFDLPYGVTTELIRRFKLVEAKGYRLPTEYRQTRIDADEAAHIAESAIMGHIDSRPGYSLGDVRFLWEKPMYWTFGAPWIPPIETEGGGMVHANVDKLDGHIWTREENHLMAAENMI